jgi:hypothetical protein
MTVPIERLLSMSAFTPLIELRKYLHKNIGLDPSEAAASLLSIDETFAASDHEAALHLHGLLHPDMRFVDFISDLRGALSHLVITIRPPWAKRVFLGRNLFLAGLDENIRHCFKQALLLGEAPEPDVVLWWDQLDLSIRGIQNFDNKIQGREFERKSLEYERARLKKLGIDMEPKWQALDDNTLGYDILSYRPGEKYPLNTMIEVKSSSRNPPVIVISRNEWEKACEAKEQYIFHLWDARSGNLVECSIDKIELHMPIDNGDGEWSSVSLPINALKKA